MVGLHFFIVPSFADQACVGIGHGVRQRRTVVFNRSQNRTTFLEVFDRQVTRVRARIGQQFMPLVKALASIQYRLGAHTKSFRRINLQATEVVRQGRCLQPFLNFTAGHCGRLIGDARGDVFDQRP